MGIFKNKRGIWYVRFSHKGHDHKKSVGTDKQQAKLIDSEIQNKIRLEKFTGLDVVQTSLGRTTFAEAATAYIDSRSDHKPSTLATYKDILKNYLTPEFGPRRLVQIKESDVRKYQSKLTDMSIRRDKLSSTRVNNIMRLLRSVLLQAQRDGSIKESPAKHVKSLSVDRIVDPLTEDEMSQALSRVDSHFKSLFTVLAYTGARPNEMLALRWSDIDWANSQIHITKGRVRGNESTPKTLSSKRSVVMLPQVSEALKTLKESKMASIDGYVFTSKSGQPINKHLDRVWKLALMSAGIRHRPSYQIRHSFASQCLLKGMSVTYVASLLGHSTIDTVVRHYARFIVGAKQSEEAKLLAAFSVDKRSIHHG